MKYESMDVDSQIVELKKLTKTSKNTELAKILSVSPSTIQTWRLRKKIPDDIFLKAQNIYETGALPTPKGYINIDYYEIEVSAGYGALVVNEEKSTDLIFRESFIHNEIGVNPKNIFLMPVKGDSMYPTLKNGALVMVHSVDQIGGDGIYVFRYDGQLMVKRLQFSKEGLKVISDNDAYEPWSLSRGEISSCDFEIIGEVVWSGQRM